MVLYRECTSLSLGLQRKALGVDVVPGAEPRQSGLCQARGGAWEASGFWAWAPAALIAGPSLWQLSTAFQERLLHQEKPEVAQSFSVSVALQDRSSPCSMSCLLLPFPAPKSQCHPTGWRERNSRPWGLSLQVQHCPHPNLSERGSRNTTGGAGQCWTLAQHPALTPNSLPSMEQLPAEAANGTGEPRVKMLLAPVSVGKHNKQLHGWAAHLAFLWGKTKRLSSPCGLYRLVKRQEKALSLSQVLCQPKKFSLQHISHAWQSFWLCFSFGKEPVLLLLGGAELQGWQQGLSLPVPWGLEASLCQRGGPHQTKPSFLVTGSPRIAVCKALSSFPLLMKPFFTLRALLQGTKACCCGQAWWDHGSKLPQCRAGPHSSHGSESRREAELECGSKWDPKSPTVAICNSYLCC